MGFYNPPQYTTRKSAQYAMNRLVVNGFGALIKRGTIVYAVSRPLPRMYRVVVMGTDGANPQFFETITAVLNYIF